MWVESSARRAAPFAWVVRLALVAHPRSCVGGPLAGLADLPAALRRRRHL